MKHLTLVVLMSLPLFAHAQSLDAEEQDMFVRINKLRDLSGLRPLRLDPALEEAARLHSERMDLLQDLSHEEVGERLEPAQRIELAGGHFATTGENIACGNEGSLDTFNQWLHSSGHLDNMTLEDYDSIGIARVGIHSANSQSCAYYWTTTFGGGHAKEPIQRPRAHPTPVVTPNVPNLKSAPIPDEEIDEDENASEIPSWDELKKMIRPYLKNW